MVIEFRPAVREGLGIFIGLAGESGSGKTWSAMALAQGIVGRGNRFAVVDTESRRARHYADDFTFDLYELNAPYSSARYEEAVTAAYTAGYKAIVVDSATHEHDGEGGYLDFQQAKLDQLVARYLDKYPTAKEWEVREKLTPSSWIQPKRARKNMMYRMIACSSSVPIIFCFRAEEKVFATKDGKLVAQNPPKWQPVCGKGMPYEMTVSFLLHADRPGYPIPIKLAAKVKDLFPLDQPLDEASGRKIAAWARGAAAAKAPEPAQAQASQPAAAPSGETPKTAPTKRDLLPEQDPKKPAPASTPVPGIDTDDESQTLAKQIEAAKATLDRQPNEAQWDRICTEVAGTAVLEMADPSALSDLLAFVRGLVAKDPAAIARARKILRAPAEEASA